MEATQQSRKLHPVLWVAAVAVILFSLAGIGAITGLIPTSSSKPDEQAAAVPAPPAIPAEPSKQAKPEPAAVPARTTAPKPVAQKPARAEVAEAPKPAAKPAPVICNNCGVIEAVREVKKQGEGSGLGAVGGAVLGGVLGHQVGGGRGKDVATVVGAVAGGVAGHQVEKHARSNSTFEVVVRYEDGTSQVINFDQAPAWREGDRVKVVNGAISAR